MFNETQESVAQWARETFGATPVMIVSARMNVEVAELLIAVAEHTGLAPNDPLRLTLESNLAHARQIAQLAVRTEGLDVADPFAKTRDEALHESGDVLVMLLQVASLLHGTLWHSMEYKMFINRQRKWGKDKDGLMQHTETPV